MHRSLSALFNSLPSFSILLRLFVYLLYSEFALRILIRTLFNKWSEQLKENICENVSSLVQEGNLNRAAASQWICFTLQRTYQIYPSKLGGLFELQNALLHSAYQWWCSCCYCCFRLLASIQHPCVSFAVNMLPPTPWAWLVCLK